jgi:Putative peptidoglycan binding domain
MRRDDIEQSEKVVDGWHLGKTSSHYESGNLGPGAVSTGKGDHGGVSYGLYQLATNTRTIDEYIEQSEFRHHFDGLKPGTPGFSAKWRQVAAEEPRFGQDQHDFIKRSHFDVQNSALIASGIDLSDRGRAVQDAIWSTSVQFRSMTPRIFSEGMKEAYGVGYKLHDLTDAEIVTAVQDYKVNHNSTLFRHSKPSWPGLIERANHERSDLKTLASAEALLASEGRLRDWRSGNVAVPDPLQGFRQLDHRLQKLARQAGHAEPRMVDGMPEYLLFHPPSKHATHDAMADGILRQGERGDAVRALQEQLNRLGVTDARGHAIPADGTYRRSTHEGVENFQLWHGLPTTGSADRGTLSAIQHAEAAMHATRAPAAPHASHQGSPGEKRHDDRNDPSHAFRNASPHTAHALSDSGHPAHLIHMRITQLLAHSETVKELGLDQHQKERLVAAATAQAVSATGGQMQTCDHVFASRHTSPQTGHPQSLILVQGDPGTDHCKRTAVDIAQGIQTPLEHSSLSAQTSLLAHHQKQQLDQPPVRDGQHQGGPMMKIGGHSLP